MNILFLDIDGVICTLRSHIAFGTGIMMQAWDITCCHMIKKLCKECDFKIVVSSTWRNGRSHDCKMQLVIYGLGDYIYGGDDFLKDSYIEWKTPKKMDNTFRGNEIHWWLNEHPEVKNYIILDDDSDFCEYQKPFLIQTDSYEGFSARDYVKIYDMMKGTTDGI